MKRLLSVALTLALGLSHALSAAEPETRHIPPRGIPVPDNVRAELTSSAAAFAKEIEKVKAGLGTRPRLLSLLPDVEIFHKSVDWALRYDEFFDPKQFDAARKELAIGTERLNQLRDGRAPWVEQSGLVVRAYRSRIDGSLQPYGLVIPDSWKATDKTPMRIDFWLHGRGEKLSELSFIEDRMRNRGEFAPEKAIVVHLYERFCNANKFAGEMDLFEALNAVKRDYPVDENRLVVRGFSMGGASCWQYGVHHAGLFAAVAPGAGFAETAVFFNSFGEGKTPPPWWEQILWRWYDSTLYANNLFNTTVIAYSGEIDKQKQAADIMSEYMAKEGLTLTHLIGPGVPHKYEVNTKPKIEELVTAAAEKGRDPVAPHVKFTTYTPIYSHMKWVQVEGLQESWQRADVDAQLQDGKIVATTKNVSALRLAATTKTPPAKVELDGQALDAKWEGGNARFHREGDKWQSGPFADGLRKTPSICGPVDHAFMTTFLMVRPTGKPMNETVGAWTKSEMEHAMSFWRQVYRGDALVKDDKAITDQDIAAANLILWGDPSSNAVIAKILAKLPLQWTAQSLKLGHGTYPSSEHAPILIFPNPLNPKRYVVINSGVTYREKALLNNSDQTPKIPDWAVVNLKTPPDAEWPGLMIDAGFFDEKWQMK
jgi:hypothetical protein